MAKANRQLGAFGESVAVRRLETLGYQIVERNVRLPEGEIDIVAIHGSVLVICEVKTRKGDSHGRAEEAITSAKAARLCRLADRYRDEHTNLPLDTRIDVVAIDLDRFGKVLSIEVIQDAVQAN